MRSNGRREGGGGGGLGARHKDHGGGGGGGLPPDLLRSLLTSPGLPPPLATPLMALEEKNRQGDLGKSVLADLGVVELIIDSLNQDYAEGQEISSDLKVARLRLLKVRLLTAIAPTLLIDSKSQHGQALLSCCCGALRRAVSQGGAVVRPEERIAWLALLAVLLCKAQEVVTAHLAEVLGYLAVLAGIHSSGSCNLVPTNLPHLHFTRTSASDPEQKEPICPDTSESELSCDELVSDSEFRVKRVEALVQRDALMNIGIIAKRLPKKEVVAFWFLFLTDPSFSPLSGSMMDLLEHGQKKARYQALAILTDFLSHSAQFLALAQHSEKASSYTSLSTALARAILSLHQTLLSRLREPLSPTEVVALLKMVSTLAENCSYSRLAPGLLDQVITACLTVAREERNPVIQVACLSVFASLCLHCTTDPAVVSAGSDVFGFMVARSKADLNSVAPDNNVRYMALQALAGLTGVQLQIFLRQAPEVR